MESAVALALMTKARLVFENEHTFLSFPLAPVVFTKAQLDSVQPGELTAERLMAMSDFAKLVNQIPDDSLTWPPVNQRSFSEAYGTVLRDARLAESSRTTEEEATYQRALGLLYVTDGNGLRTDSAKFTCYKQYRDRWFLAAQEYKEASVNAETSTSAETKAQWQGKAGSLKVKLEDVEREWRNLGFRAEVEQALRDEETLGAKSAQIEWRKWSSNFDPLLWPTDTNGFQFPPASFSPANVTTSGWLPFSLNSEQVDMLAAQAPPQLRQRLGEYQTDLDIEQLTFEFTSLVIERSSWFEETPLTSRIWRFADPNRILSDGQIPGKGECPAYVRGLVLARNLQVKLRPNSPKNEAAVAKLNQGALAMLMGFKLAPITSNMMISTPTLQLSPILTARIERPSISPIMTTRMARPDAISSQDRFDTLIPIRPGFERIDPPIQTGGQKPPEPKPPEQKPPKQETTSPDDLYVIACICKAFPSAPNPDLTLRWDQR